MTEEAIAALEAAGFDRRTAIRAARMLSRYVMGFTFAERAPGEAPPPSDSPALDELLASVAATSQEELFEFGLETLLGASRPGATPPERRAAAQRPLRRPRVSTTSKSRPVIRPRPCRSSSSQPAVRRAGHVPGRAVVGQDHPVALQGDEHGARLRPEPGQRHRRLQPHAQPHRRQRRVGRVAGGVARGVDVARCRVRGAVKRRAWSMPPRARPRRSGPGRAGSAGRRRRRWSSRPGRRRFERRSKTAPEPAVQRRRRPRRAANSS